VNFSSLKEQKMMRRADTRLAGKVGLTLMVALVLVLALVGVVLAQPSAAPDAPQIPGRPHAFWGNVTTDRGKPLPAGTVVTAKALSGAWTGTVTGPVDASSRYGWEVPFQVPGSGSQYDGTGADDGDPIAFYVLGVQARLHDVGAQTWSNTYPFRHGGHTNLDLQVAIKYTITATAGAHGSIAPSGAVQVDYGFDQAFTITPDSAYLILDVLVDGVSNPAAVASGSYTFVSVTANHTISVTFVKATYVITPTASTGCKITPGIPQTVPYKGSKSFAVTADKGYDLTDVKVDGVSNPGAVALGGYTFTNVQADHTIAAICTKHIYRAYLPLVMR
jgi:hypothetical protein